MLPFNVKDTYSNKRTPAFPQCCEETEKRVAAGLTV